MISKQSEAARVANMIGDARKDTKESKGFEKALAQWVTDNGDFTASGKGKILRCGRYLVEYRFPTGNSVSYQGAMEQLVKEFNIPQSAVAKAIAENSKPKTSGSLFFT